LTIFLSGGAPRLAFARGDAANTRTDELPAKAELPMDQTTTFAAHDRHRAAARLADFIAQSVDNARAVETPFYHREFDRVFPGYRITPHTDTHWKGITVQLYLPADDANTDIGTIFHERLADG
jgi:hypothetical protein